MIKVTQSEEEMVKGLEFSTGTYSCMVYSFTLQFKCLQRLKHYYFSPLYEQSTIK